MAQLMLVNPRKRKRKTTTSRKRRSTAARTHHKKRTYRRNPIRATSVRRTSRRKYRRNPIKAKGLLAPLMPAAISATGAIGLDLAWGVIGSKLPAGLSSGPMKYIAKAAGALGLGALAGMVTKKDTANQMAVGALTVVLHGAMKDTIQNTLPNVSLGEYMPEMYGLGEYVPDMMGMDEYMPDMQGIGYTGGGEYFNPYEATPESYSM